MSYASTPTGIGISILGATIGQGWLVAAGVGVVLAGALIARFAFRSNKSMDEV